MEERVSPARINAVPLLWYHICVMALTSPCTHQSDLPIDCGTAALYFYLKLENIDVDVQKLVSFFPELPENGHSFATIENVARNFGIELVGVRLASIPASLHGPIIVHSNYGPKGHFVVINPIKNRKDVIIVIDAVFPPRIVDKIAFSESNAWTGFALMKRPSHHLQYCLIASGLVVGVVLTIAYMYVSRFAE
jgi:ABC-type bacteriocin/lantibiotic exporter with double-glycine peptidase domain